MNKKLMPIVVVVLLLALGGYYFISQRGAGPQSLSQNMNEARQFAQAIESGKPTTCQITKDFDVMEYFIKGKMMRANIKTTIDNQTTLSYMINDATNLYLWTDAQKQGTKMAITQEEYPQPEDQNTKVDTFASEADYQNFQDMGYTINCQSGNFSDSIFTPPADIEFIDPTAIMQALPSPDANGGYDMSQLEELQKQYGGMTPQAQ